MKAILLTGATGFLGSQLLEKLLSRGYSVVVLKRSFSDTRRIRRLAGKFKSYDVDKGGMDRAFAENSIGAVIHTATKYGRKGESLSEMLETNTIFPLRLLELAIKNRAGAFFNTDTILPENLDTYVYSKSQFVHYAKGICGNRIKFVNLKLEHMYGPGDDTIKFIPYIAESMVCGKGSIDLTAGEQRRGFIHISDVVSAYMVLLSRLQEFKGGFHEFEVGSGESYRIKDVVELAARLSGSKARLNFGALPYRKNEVMNSKIKTAPLKKLGWAPRTGLEEGLRETIEWTRKNAKCNA